MYIHHNSHLIHFRSPFGAVPTESKIKLSLEIDCQSEIYSALIRLWNGSEQLIEMTESKTDGSKHIYSATVSAPEKPCLLWYYFIVNSSEGTFYYSNNERRLGGIGVMTDYPTDISYQITVFDKDFRTPDWFKNSIMYQIFPDRFYASEQGTDLSAKKTPYTMHKDWYEPIYFDRHPFENGPACNDFYGGNFKGICEKIPYLKALGISVLYLNPIFEAFSNHRYDTADYSNKHLSMFAGDIKPVELICKNEIIEEFIDRFGEKCLMKAFDDEHFIAKFDVAVTNGLVSWIMQFGDSIKVRGPKELKNMIIDKTNSILSMYNG